jgi:hypothetical protein
MDLTQFYMDISIKLTVLASLSVYCKDRVSLLFYYKNYISVDS